MIIRFSDNKTKSEGFVVADKVVSDLNILKEVIRDEDTVVFYDMDSAFSSLAEVLSFVEEMMNRSVFVIFEKEQMRFTSMNDEKCATAVKMLKSLSSFVGCKKKDEKPVDDVVIDNIMTFYKKNADRFEWNDASRSLDRKLGYRRICRGFVEYYMRPDDFKSRFVDEKRLTSKDVYRILKSVDALIYETGRNDTSRRFGDGQKRYIGIRIRSENEVNDNARSGGRCVPSWVKYIQNEELKEKMFPSSKKEVKTVLTNTLRDEIIELAFGGMSVYELSKHFNIEVKIVKNILGGFM